MLSKGLYEINRGLTYGQNVRYFGANLKALKIRMKAIGNIKKITSAMKMVATARMKQDVMRLNRGKHFGVNVVPTILENDGYMNRKKSEEAPKKTLVVALTGDKGLCGSVNTQIVRHVRATINADRSHYSLFCIGDKGTQGLVRNFPDKIDQAITEIRKPMNFWTASSIAGRACNYDPTADSILLVYSFFKNSMTFPIKEVRFLPPHKFYDMYKNMVKYEAEEPEKGYNMPYYYELYTSSIFYVAFINSIAAEQASKMNAMEGATKNAGEMLDKITLEYNKARQAKITMELVEIVSGASAV